MIIEHEESSCPHASLGSSQDFICLFLMKGENIQHSTEQPAHSSVGAWRCVYMASIEAVSSGINLGLVEMRIPTL